MNKVEIEDDFVVIKRDNSSKSCKFIGDGRQKKLLQLSKIYPSLDSFEPVSELYFSFHFNSFSDLYYFVFLYAYQHNFRLTVKYAKTEHMKKVTFKCRCDDCSFYVIAHYNRYTVNVKFNGHNHPLIRIKSGFQIDIMTNEISNLVDNLVRHSRSSNTGIINIVKDSFNVSSKVLKQVNSLIRKIRVEMRNEVEGLIKFKEIVKDKYTLYEDKDVMLIIMDEFHLYKYNTILGDGTFGCFLTDSQLYTIYVQVSPSLILLVAFAVTKYKNKETYKFIYSKLNKYNTIKYCIHDKESAVLSTLNDLGIIFINDTFHLFLYIKDKKIKSLLYNYIKFPELRNKIVDDNPEIIKYLNKEGVDDFGLFGCHSTSQVESVNKDIKSLINKKKSRSDSILTALETIYTKQLTKINSVISKSMENKDNIYTIWPECMSNFNSQLNLLISDSHEMGLVSKIGDGITCSCKYREVTGIPCHHILYEKIKNNLDIDIKNLIANEAFINYFNSEYNITNYNIGVHSVDIHDEILDSVERYDEIVDIDSDVNSYNNNSINRKINIPKRYEIPIKRKRNYTDVDKDNNYTVFHDEDDNINPSITDVNTKTIKNPKVIEIVEDTTDVDDDKHVELGEEDENRIFDSFIEFNDELSISKFNKIISCFGIDILDPYVFYTTSEININNYIYIPICFEGHWSHLYNRGKLIHFDSTGDHIRKSKYIYNRLNITNTVIPYIMHQEKGFTCGYFAIHSIFCLNKYGYINDVNDETVIKTLREELTNLYIQDRKRILRIILEE